VRAARTRCLSSRRRLQDLNDPSVQRAVPALQTELRHCLVVTRQLKRAAGLEHAPMSAQVETECCRDMIKT
jgi:hypothetical protein